EWFVAAGWWRLPCNRNGIEIRCRHQIRADGNGVEFVLAWHACAVGRRDKHQEDDDGQQTPCESSSSVCSDGKHRDSLVRIFFGFNCGKSVTSRTLSWPKSIMHRRLMP